MKSQGVINSISHEVNVIYKTKEKYITLLICFMIGFEPIKRVLLLSIRTIIALPFKLDVALIYGLYGLVFIYALRLIVIRIKLDIVLLFIFFVIQYFLSFMINPNYTNYFYQIGYDLFIVSLPCYILARCVKDFTTLIKFLQITSILVTVSGFFLIFVFKTLEGEVYSQSMAYLLLPASIISVNALFENFKLIYFINALISFSLVLFDGARGPIVCIFLFIATKLVFILKNNFKKLQIAIISMGLLIVITNYYWNNIIFTLQKIIIKYNLSDRFILFLINNTLFVDNERNQMKDISLQIIRDNVFIGTGIANDRLLLSQNLGFSLNEAIGLYPHNIFLEIPLQFGMLFGIIIISIILYLIIKSLKVRDKILRDIILIFLGIGFYPLLFSGSYLSTPFFFALIGFCVNSLKRLKVKS